MNKKRFFQIALSLGAVLAAIPGAMAAAKKLDAYEFVWLIPVFPAFTITFFWILIVMVDHFIAADSYRDPHATAQARQFLKIFEGLFFVVLFLFIVAAWFVFTHFQA